MTTTGLASAYSTASENFGGKQTEMPRANCSKKVELAKTRFFQETVAQNAAQNACIPDMFASEKWTMMWQLAPQRFGRNGRRDAQRAGRDSPLTRHHVEESTTVETSKPHSTVTTSLLLREQGTGNVASTVTNPLSSSDHESAMSLSRRKDPYTPLSTADVEAHIESSSAGSTSTSPPSALDVADAGSAPPSGGSSVPWIALVLALFVIVGCVPVRACVCVRQSSSGLHWQAATSHHTVTIAFAHVSLLSQSFSPSAIVFSFLQCLFFAASWAQDWRHHLGYRNIV